MCYQNYLLSILFCCYFQTVCAIESRVYDGQDLRFEVHKYLVKIKAYHRLNAVSRCSGSIIDQSWIITAAHCFKTDVEIVDVFRQNHHGLRLIAKVARKNIYSHPSYVGDSGPINYRSVDIALMKTSSPIKFNAYVQPVKLTEEPFRIGQSAIIAGFGKSEDHMAYPREGSIVLVSCPRNVQGVICSIDTVRAGSGDSGGSLTSKGYLIGVTSASCINVHIHKKCITIYADVFSNLDWITEVIHK
ncbi:thrombin-like enzyme kangshuanmei [Achroia grisella]|uniref:thrombin-like enzyme kangshuanmei n=1 Tax=Achroia grisella TaxID=688607 RepID=UPI0027D20F88|nr:thrombin-like enzyme kangshuanmei [Achroia grisella]